MFACESQHGIAQGKSRLNISKRHCCYIDGNRKADAETFEKRRPEKSPAVASLPVISRVCRSCPSLVLFPALLSRKEFNQTTLRIESTRTKLNRMACSGRGENFSWRMKRHPREIFDEFERK